MSKRKRFVLCGLAASVLAAVFMLFPAVFAADQKVIDVMSVVYTVLKYISTITGVIMVIVGLLAFVLAKQNDNSPDEHKAIVKLAVGIVLIILFTVIIKEDGLWQTLVNLID